MRNPDRIEPFMEEMGDLWKKHFPDWRFGQVMFNFFSVLGDPFHLEEEQFLVAFEAYCKGENPREAVVKNLKEKLDKGYER